jgi:hypothetical protein
MLDEFIKFWRKCKLETPPFAHPADLPMLKRDNGKFADLDAVDFDAFVAGKRFGDFDDHRFHLSLLPVPYNGNLRRADIVILLLNPGFSYTDYWAETKVPEFRNRRADTLRQSFKRNVKFPFLSLDPQFCWHSSFVWWEKKLRGVATIIADEKYQGRYLDALRDLSNRMACVELVPYHSASFKAHPLICDLPSVKMARAFVRESLVPDARAGGRTLIVTRQEKAWNVPARPRNLVVYRRGQTRGASLSPRSEGGRAILRRYGII